jgi:protoporphyrinogen/coproporphyrinogen III oxidase
VRREESVQGFITRHFGYEAARVFAGPFVQGISAGDARRLSLDAMFPRLRQLEASHGSLLRGLAAAHHAARSGARRRAPGRLTSFRDGGIQRLVDALAADLGERVRTDTPVVGIRHAPGRHGESGVVVELASGETVEDERLVIAAPAYVAADLVATVAPEASAALREIRYVDIDVLGFGFDRVDVPYPLDGFGFLVPRAQRKVRVLGASWSSVLFPDQAPEGKVGLRVLAGGALDPGFTDLPDEEALGAARRDLETTMGIAAEPEYQRRIRWQRGIPQFELGHRARVERARAALTLALPGARLAGNYLDGIGLNDAVRTARAAVRSLLPLGPETP